MKNVLEFLEKSTLKYPDKIVARDPEVADTFMELRDNAMRTGSFF